MMKAEKLFLIIFMFAALSTAAIATPTNLMPWYTVQPWEIDVCSKRPVIDSPVSISSSFDTISYKLNSQYTATLQAQKKPTYAPSGQQSNLFLYEVAFYIQPLYGSVHYTVELVPPTASANADNDYLHQVSQQYGFSGTLIYEGAASSNIGDAKYFAFYLNNSYVPDHVKLTIEGQETINARIIAIS